MDETRNNTGLDGYCDSRNTRAGDRVRGRWRHLLHDELRNHLDFVSLCSYCELERGRIVSIQWKL